MSPPTRLSETDADVQSQYRLLKCTPRVTHQFTIIKNVAPLRFGEGCARQKGEQGRGAGGGGGGGRGGAVQLLNAVDP